MPEAVDMILPFFIESLEFSDASVPGLLRRQLLDAVARMASLGFKKSYCEAVVLMTRSYLSKLSAVVSAETDTTASEATIERLETLPAGFLLIARDLTTPKLRTDYRHRLLSLCTHVGLAAVSKSGKSGADFLGPLLPAVAEICSDSDPAVNVEPSLLKLFRNLWFYVALFGLAPPLNNHHQGVTKLVSTTLNSIGRTGAIGLQAVSGPYMWSADWFSAVQRISQGTPPLVVTSEKWLENEFELNALHNPGSWHGSGNEKAAISQRTALSAALGECIEVSAMNTFSAVKSTYLLAVMFLEVTRFSSNGGILSVDPSSTTSRSAFSCVFEYLKSPGLPLVVFQCLTAIVHRAFGTAVAWLEDRMSEIGMEAEYREFTLSTHARFLVQNLSQRDEHIRDISVNLLNQLRDRFPQILWNSSCLDSLLFSVHNDPPSSVVDDPACVATIRSLYQRTLREWIIVSLSQAPCTSQGLLQEKLYKTNTGKKSQPTAQAVSLLSEIKIGIGKNDYWTGTRPANIPAVMAAAAAASGAKLKLTDSFTLEVLSTGMIGATVKCMHAGEIAGVRRLYYRIGSLDHPASGPGDMVEHLQPETESFTEVLLAKFVRMLQKFVNEAEKGGEVDKSSFRETCSQATALLLCDMASDPKSNAESFSQLLSLLCWCPAYILTPDAMDTGVFIWTWLVSAAPQLCSLVLAELVDAWLWTVDTKRGLFASQIRCCGPVAMFKPHLVPGEPEAPPEKDPVEQIMAHRLWLGFFIDRFEVVQHDSFPQLLLLGRLLQQTTEQHWNFSSHPAATGTFFTFMLLGLKFCSCKSLGNLQNLRAGLQLLEGRIYRASFWWFAHQPEWYDLNKNFALSEAQSVSMFVYHLLNEQLDTPQLDPSLTNERLLALENRSSLNDVKDQYHPVWGKMGSYAVGREKRKQLLLMLCQHEADRLDVWAKTTARESTSRLKISSVKWIDLARTAFSVDPRLALCVAARFPTNNHLKAEVEQLVQLHILEMRHIPEALPYLVTPKAIDENSTHLQQFPHWAACSITQALEFLTPAYKGHPCIMAYVLRVLESYPPQTVTFFMP
ncbi:Phosphatidylinositol 4-kinase alpha 1 [Capsicum annuum]|uniref:1-phosphatidylinositol 4-kinase n=1 Tax=Capsicum annuum TaxID=4072 RepID=A0A2G2ZL89_CAPAN|nr:Phosphatidylinositol 4-kinase alpha 1 [Capsicum annuum]